MLGVAEMASKGRDKLSRKSGSMASNWDAAKGRMKTGYGDTPFSASIKSAYNAGIDAATYNAPDPDKWARNWTAKMTGG